MSDDAERINAHADRLHAARRAGTTTDLVTASWPDISPEQAKVIASATLALSGEHICGFKLGYTSEAMRKQMNIDRPNFGRLTQEMNFSDQISPRLIHPRVEPEIALRIGRDIDAMPNSPTALISSIDAVFPALEIVDTRYHDYVFRFADNIADNSSAAGFVLGEPQLPTVLEGNGFAVSLETGTATALAGHSSAAMGGPLSALLWLCRELEGAGEKLRGGSIILTGGLTAAPPLIAGEAVTAKFDQLGSASFTWHL